MIFILILCLILGSISFMIKCWQLQEQELAFKEIFDYLDNASEINKDGINDIREIVARHIKTL
jgi:hypothetical protein